ncbi:MAG: hypothetical protein AB4368_05540 [Xenococcaceae cyanobacterium]
MNNDIIELSNDLVEQLDTNKLLNADLEDKNSSDIGEIINHNNRINQSFSGLKTSLDSLNYSENLGERLNGTFQLKNQRNHSPERLSSIFKASVTGYNLSEVYLKRVLRRSHLCFDYTAIAKIKQELTWTQYLIST